MCAVLDIPRGARVLEIGCGTGNALPPLWRHLQPRELVGVDTDLALLDSAKVRLARHRTPARVKYGDAQSLPFGDGSFDVVVDFGTSYHVDHQALAVAEIERVLSPGGLWVHETRIAQFLAHPVHAGRTRVPRQSMPLLTSHRSAGLWASRRCDTPGRQDELLAMPSRPAPGVA
jgi:ubiquinone/menaquinone biosynthesis C-methylase UbiE